MRNLKKVLSLTLALVMMLGMMTFAGAAETKMTSADLKDMDKVANKEAVSLLVDLGIINGIKQADGTYNFNPAGNIERGAYAKMVYAVMMASDNADVYKGVNTGLTDVKGHWAEGFIGYCVSTKIAVGNPNKTFAPAANISVVAATKMLLTALGYDAKASGYENDALWSINIMRDAQSAGLMAGIKQAAGDTMTRDTAAQLIYNALFAKTVTPKFAYDMGVKYLDEYREGKALGEQVYSLVKVADIVDTVTSGKADFSGTVTANGTASINVTGTITGKLAATPDMVGSQATFYVKGSVTGTTLTVDKIYSSALIANSSTVLATVYGYKETGTDALTALLVTAATKVASLEAGLSETATTVAPTTLVYYLNGVKASAGAANPDATITVGDAQALVGKRGVVVEFKNTNDKAGVDTVVITEKKVVTLAAAPVVGTDSKGDTVVSISSLGLTKVPANTVVGYEGLAKDDVVLYVTAGGVTYLEKAASVAGKATGLHSTKGMLLNGAYYLTSALAGTVNAWANDYTGEYTFYLDNGKNIVKAVKTAGETTSNYAMILEAKWVTGTGEIGKSEFAQAKLLFADGTTEIVTIAKVGGTAPTNVTGLTKNQFHTYTINDDKAYELSTKLTTADAASVNITKGAAKFDGTTVGNANTVFLVKSGTDPFTFTSYKGIANVPSMTLTNVNKGVVVKKDSVATHVFLDITDGTLAGGSGDIVYLTSTDYATVPKIGNVPEHRVYDAIVNGVKTTVKLSGASIADKSSPYADFTEAIEAKVLYEVKGSDANGIVSKLAKQTLETGISVSGGTLVSSTTVATVDAGTEIFYINSDGEVNTLTAETVVNDKTDKVFVVAKDGLAEKVFIMQAKSADKAISKVTYTIDGGAAVTASISADGDITTGASTDATKTIVITGVTTSDEATWAVSGTCVVVANAGPVTAANQIVITVTPEDGSASATYTIGFKAAV